jgi:glycosyltransferase involved in cell wall biosynthesis
MTSLQITILGIYAGIVAIWPIRYLVIGWVLRQVEVLTPRSPGYSGAETPHVSVIIPAKDEEANLGRCLSSVRGQQYPNLEIIVVDDRSADRTGEIAREHAALDPRIKVMTMTELAPGWTGKTHALQRASETATGDWLWFIDADTTHHPKSLTVMMDYGRREKAELVSILPDLQCETFWEKLVQPLGGITLMQSFPLPMVNDDRRPLAFANGQSILIGRQAYKAAGGHEAVRDRFVEDIGMAYKVKQLGLPIRTTLTRDLVHCRMYSSFGQLMRGWSRILYDALDRKTWRLAARLLDPLIFCQSGHVALIVAIALVSLHGFTPFANWLLGISIVHHVLMYIVLRRIYHISDPGSRHVGFYPLANLVIDLILVRAIWMCLTGRVAWRGTVYPKSWSAPGEGPEK